MGFIEVEQVVKRYGDFTALRGVDLTVEEGEFLCLLGPSGCGKTTLMRSIAGLTTIEGGRISVGGQRFSEPGLTIPPERRKLGMVFQSYALWPHMTVFGNIAYTLKTNKWPKAEIKDRVREVLDIVGLPGLEDRYAGQLSGGQMQRVAVARSLAPEPRVLLFDEPLSNLDSKLREKMRFELRQIQQRVGITALYVTHDQSEAMVVADRIALMKDGELVQLGSAKDLYEKPRSPFAAEFMGVTNFVSAEVVRTDGSTVHLRLPGDVTIAGRLATGSETAAGSDGPVTMTVAVRPEHLRTSTTQPAESAETNVLPGVVDDIVYLGNLADLYVRVGDTVLRTQAVPDDLDGWTTGMDVWVSVEERRVRAVAGERTTTDERAKATA
ncbi:MAG: ATP-binding cassette domain-containing protein [Streptosporangiales bacterium]|nr:ATP-binding cassette domain-containing protein [Streptosporangiales bacterium]